MEEDISDNEEVRIFTSIKSDFYRRKMIKGTFIALVGVFVLVYCGSLVRPNNFHLIGLPVLFLGGLLIALGVIPLRRITKLQENPNELIASKTHIQYIVNEELIFTLPIEAISTMQYVEEQDLYGIVFSLKDKKESGIIVHAPGFNFSKFMEKSNKKTGADLFLPYFRRRSFSRLGFLKRTLN